MLTLRKGRANTTVRTTLVPFRPHTDSRSDVQISTGVSQWDLPTSEAPIGASPSGTPAQSTNPYDRPDKSTPGLEGAEGTRGIDGPTGDRAGGLGVCYPSKWTVT